MDTATLNPGAERAFPVHKRDWESSAKANPSIAYSRSYAVVHFASDRLFAFAVPNFSTRTLAGRIIFRVYLPSEVWFQRER